MIDYVLEHAFSFKDYMVIAAILYFQYLLKYRQYYKQWEMVVGAFFWPLITMICLVIGIHLLVMWLYKRFILFQIYLDKS